MHKSNLPFLAIELFKDIKGNSPPILNELFNRNERNNYNLRNHSDFSLPKVFGWLETLSYLGPKLWEIIQPEINVFNSLLEFKNKVGL